MKELLEKSVRTDIDGLPFTEEGYAKAKDILEAEYGQSTEIVNAYVQGIMNLPVVTGTNPKKIQDFYKQLRYNVQSLDTLGKLADVKGNVRATLDKLKGIKDDLVRGNEGWQEWGFNDLLGELKKWRDTRSKKPRGGNSSRTRLFNTRDSQPEARTRSCVYCEDDKHKSADCPKVTQKEERRRILAGKKFCFNCTGFQHRLLNQDRMSKMSQKISHVNL